MRNIFITKIRKQSNMDLMVKNPNCRVEKKELIKLSWSGWRSCQVIESFLFVISPGYYIYWSTIYLMLKIAQLNIFLTLVRKLCAISSFMMCRQLCLVHQLGVITQSSAEFNNAETLEVTFSKIYMTRSQRWNKNALITVT